MAKNKISVEWIAIYEDMFTDETIAECAEKSNVDTSIIIVALQQIYFLIAKRGNGENKVDRVSTQLLHSFVQKSPRKASEVMRNIASFGLVNIKKRCNNLHDIEVEKWAEYQKPLADKLKEIARNRHSSAVADEKKKDETNNSDEKSTQKSTCRNEGSKTSSSVNTVTYTYTKEQEQGLKGLDLKENKKPDEAPKPDVVSNSFYSTQTQDIEPEAKSIKNDYQEMEITERRNFFNDKDFEIDENGKCIKNRNILKEFHAEGKNLIEIYVKNIDPKRTGDTMNPCDTMLLQIARHGLGAVKDMVYAYQRYLNTAPSSESVVGVRNFFENGKYVQYIGKCGLKPKTPESRMFAALERTGLTHGLANEILTIDKSTTELFIKAGLNREELEGVFTNTYTDLERTESNFEQILIKQLKAINA